MKTNNVITDEHQLLLVNKPLGWTSFDVVKKLRNLLKVKKIGHAGTLDPLATGLLLLGINRGTKRLAEYQNLDKTYEGTLVLGKTTPSFDLETSFDTTTDYSHLTSDDIRAVRNAFLGTQKQRPPSYSACKVNGVRAYEKVRKGDAVTLEKRTITIRQFDLVSLQLPTIHFIVTCTKGTYIRSLAHDFGQHLKVGAYLSALHRTDIGDYNIKDAYTIAELEKKYKNKPPEITNFA